MQGKVSFRVSKKNKLLKAIKPGLPADKVKFAGKRARPVNLKLTGALHRSIKKRVTKSGLTIWFSDEKAEWHNEGTDKMPARRLLPLEGEELSRVIEKELEKSLTDIVQTAFK